MGKVIGIEHLSYTKVTNLNHLIFLKEDVQGFDIAMEYFILVDVLETHTNLEEESPDFVLFQIFFVLLFEEIG